jgi:hypothetical protein
MKKRLIAVALLFSWLSPAVARADCSGPAGVEAEVIYNADYHVMQFCNGTDWVAMGGISPAAGGSSADWYQTSSQYGGADADTACDTGYHMCFPSEWYGHPYNTSKNASPHLDSYSYIEGGSNLNCNGWTDSSNTYAGLIAYINTSTGHQWYFNEFWCGDGTNYVLCCSD